MIIIPSKTETEFNIRTKRSPDSESIQRWKLAFSGDLSTPFASSKKLPQILTCNWALNELCLKHVSCRELWALFRRNCVVDALNNCRMSNKNDCWQSYEGISWTGLGSCKCPGNNSDCHWIRLQTTYNKCIFELNNDASWHVQLNSLAQFSANRRGIKFASNPTSGPLTSIKIPPPPEALERKIESESEDKRRQILANEARVARIHAQEQRKLQLKAEQEMEQRRKDKMNNERKNNYNSKNSNNFPDLTNQVNPTSPTYINKTSSINNEATIKFQNVILKDEKPKQNLLKTRLQNSNGRDKFDAENNFKEQNKHQTKFENQNKHQNKFVKQKEHKNMVEHENKFEKENKLKNKFEEEKNKSEHKNKIQETSKTNKTLAITITMPATKHNNNKTRNNSETKSSPKHNSEQIFPTQTNEHLVTQAEIPPTQITELLLRDQNKEEKPFDGNNVTLNENSPKATIIPTCPQIIEICEKDDTTACNWHLSELNIKCPQTFDENNNKDICLLKKREPQCSAALSRFVRFVSTPLVEAMLFCNPSDISEGNLNKMLPSVLQLNPKECSSNLDNSNEHKQRQTRWSCTQTAKMCKAEPRCNHYLNYLLSHCTISNITSPHELTTCLLPDNPTSMRRCRIALARSRGTWLDENCHCLSNGGGDYKECKKWETTLWPRNPCIDKVTVDFNNLYIGGYIKLDHKIRNKANITLPKKPITKNREFGSIERGVFLLEEDKGGRSLDKEEDIIKEKISKKSNENSESSENNGEEKGIDTSRWRLTKAKTATPPPTTETEHSITEDEEIKEENNKNKNKQLLSYYLDKKQENETNNNIDQVEFIKKRKRPTGRKIANKNNNKTFINADQFDVNEFQTPKLTNEGRGCRTRNIEGEWVEHYTDSIFRQYQDWSGRCSSWCECLVKGKEDGKTENASSHAIRCHSLGCLQDLQCETKHTTIVFGQRLYLENRGACQCHNGQFICDSSELKPELEPGIYLSLGYSQAEIDIIRDKVPKLALERSGLISYSNSLIKDLATRLQFALERLLPSGLRCRFVVVEHFKSEQVVLMQIQWYGIDHSANQTQPKWQSGKMEKHCSPYVRELELTFWLEKSERYQLLLSTIKQVRASDLLDALPLTSACRRNIIFNFKLLIILILAVYRRLMN